jgi:hypothetical protein
VAGQQVTDQGATRLTRDESSKGDPGSTHGKNGIAYDEIDPAQAHRETIIRNFLSGQYSNALRVIAFNTAEGWSRRRAPGALAEPAILRHRSRSPLDL